MDSNSRNQYILMRFGEVGTKLWREGTKNATGNYLLFVVDNELVASPFVNSEITGGSSAFSRGDYSESEYQIIEEKINKDRGI